MGQALYRKYRSKSLKEIVGQEHITDTLGKALEKGHLSHAYLFTGPRGVGKTSIARILAHEINKLPYDEQQNHIDIIEIDAASNRRIDEIRDLREKVYIAPALAKYKVYIIDEVHMLTREAFNALLKTLEEPPAHVVFILATTEAHKLPETIISRTQRFTFRPIEPAKVVSHLKFIAKQEGIAITDDALELIAKHGDGSFRDSISLLDQLSGHGEKIDVDDVRASLGIPSSEAVDELLMAIESSSSAKQLLEQLNALYEQGFQATAIAKELAQRLRAQLIEGTLTLDGHPVTTLLGKLLEVPAFHDPDRYLEVILLAELQLSNQHGAATSSEDTPTLPTPPKQAKVTVIKPESTLAPAKPKVSRASSGVAVVDDANWNQVLGKLKSQHNTLYGIIRMAQPDFTQPGKLRLTFAFAFHQKRMNETKNQRIIADAVKAVTGSEAELEIECLLDPQLKISKNSPAASPKAAPVAVKPPDDKSLATISNIFGSAEVLES